MHSQLMELKFQIFDISLRLLLSIVERAVHTEQFLRLLTEIQALFLRMCRTLVGIDRLSACHSFARELTSGVRNAVLV